MLIFIIIAGALLVLSKSKATGQVSKAGGNLAGVGTPGALSSTPIPKASANSPTATPPFYQFKNANTPSEPITTESFNPIDFSKDESGTLAPAVRTSTLHNNHILDNYFNKDNQFIQKPISGKFISDTELSSVSEEQYYSYLDNTGVPDVTESDRVPFFPSAKIANAGGTNGTHPTAPAAVNIASQVPSQHASTLAPSPSRNVSIEHNMPVIVSRVIKSSLQPTNVRQTNSTPNIFTPLKSVYGA